MVSVSGTMVMPIQYLGFIRGKLKHYKHKLLGNIHEPIHVAIGEFPIQQRLIT
jgi:hypothetical protein